MVAYLDQLLTALPTDPSIRTWQNHLRRLARLNQAQFVHAHAGFEAAYKDIFYDSKALAFPASFVETDMFLITNILTKPAHNVIGDMTQWWINGRGRDILLDLASINEATGNPYLHDIFALLKVGPEDPTIFLPIVAELIMNDYLNSLFKKISTLTPADPQGIIDWTRAFQIVGPHAWSTTLLNFMAAQTTDHLSVETATTAAQHFYLHTKLETAFEVDPGILSELGRLVSWFAALPPFITSDDPIALSQTISQYLFSEDVNGHFILHLLMKELIDPAIEPSIDQKKYGQYQYDFFKKIFKKLFKLAHPEIKEEDINVFLHTEIHAQASVSKHELKKLLTSINAFSAGLGAINTPTVQNIFNENAQMTIRVFYAGEGLRVSSAEKNKLKELLVGYAHDAARTVKDTGLILSPSLLGSFIKDMAGWICALFVWKESSATSATEATPILAPATSVAEKHVLEAATQMQTQLEQKFAPPSIRSSRASSPPQ